MIIGLTGKTGSGKSTVAGLLRKMGFYVCDADLVAREVMEKGSALLPKLAEAFGGDIINENGELDRKKLAARAFSGRSETEKLNALTHPAIIEKSFAEMKNALDNGYKAAFFDAAALFESGAASRCDFTVCVTAPESVRFSRIIERDGLSPDEAERRMNAQKADDFYTGRSDFVIDNSPGRDLASQVGELVRLLKL
ncbi:MAG: dephospho-CoA kinase [Acutalibacteraceae bacterium]|nr:dephospho-CoA kinase [Oscillospiraceae bacterium]